MAVLGVDVGGTFTDAVVLDGGVVTTAKVLTAAHQEDSVLASARAAGAVTVERFAHGTTVATNALLERKGARTAFVTTAGFEHLLHLRRQTRAQLYRPCAAWPEPLVPLERSHGVRGRMGPDGEFEPLDLGTLPDIDADAVAVCLLHAYRDPAHERAVVEELRRRLPGAHVVASHEVAPEFREYERASTTAADAYLGPVVARYLGALAAAAVDAGLPVPLVMRSSGGVATPDEAAEHPATILVSGPAAGVVGAARLAALAGIEDAIAFDMGGTSTDVCLIAGGRAERAERANGRRAADPPSDRRSAHRRRRRRLARLDRRGRRAARRAAERGREPRPGVLRTRRDAGRPSPTRTSCSAGCRTQLAGGVELDRAAAERALAGIDPAAVVDVVNAEMLRALRVVSVERGHDPADFALVAFGGAGPLHACELADELGIRTVLVPEVAGVLSALGLVASEERQRRGALVSRPARGRRRTTARRRSRLRYAGQSFELTLPLQEDLAEAFHRAPRRAVRVRGARP